MANTISEVGNAKNVLHFDDAIDILAEMGNLYNPANQTIALSNLKGLNEKLQKNHEEYKEVTSFFKKAVPKRAMLYEPMNKLGTRFLNAFKAFNFGKQIDNTMISYNKKLRGQRIVKLKKKNIEEEETQTISVAQTSYDSKAETFDEMIKYAEAIPEYKPNEEDLKTESLDAYYKQIMVANKETSQLSAKMITGRVKRDELLYDGEENVIELMRTVKKYLKSVKGGEEYYKKIVKLKFRDRNRT